MKYFWMPFETAAWKKDMRRHPKEIRGLWIDAICSIWDTGHNGSLTMTTKEWASELGATETETEGFLEYLETHQIADVTNSHGDNHAIITVKSRRIERWLKSKQSDAFRQAKRREKIKSHGKVTPIVTVQSKSKSKSKSKNKKLEVEKEKDLKIKEKTLNTFVAPQKQGNPNIKLFIDFYFQEFEKRFNEKPVFSGKDASLVQKLLSNRDLESVKSTLLKFFDSKDDFILRAGFSIGVFYSQFNKMLSGIKPGVLGKHTASNLSAMQEALRKGGNNEGNR